MTRNRDSSNSFEMSLDEKKEESPMVAAHLQPPPMMGGIFHPSYMFCGECAECEEGEGTPPLSSPASVPEVELGNLSPGRESLGKSANDASIIHTKLVLAYRWKAPTHRLVLESLLKPLTGVKKVLVDLNGGGGQNKSCIYVDHDAQCSTDDMLRVLQQGGYPAKVEAVHEKTDMDELMASQATADDPSPKKARPPPTNPVNVVRSTLFVQGVCCATEVPSVRKIVRPIPGVASLQVNITTKRVYVQHDPALVSAPQIAERLTQQGFTTALVHNGATHNSPTLSPGDAPVSTVGRSTLHTEKVLHKEDVPLLQKRLATLNGVHRIGVNLLECVVYVEHDFMVIPASKLVEILETRAGYKSTLVQDAEAVVAQNAATAALLAQPRSKYVETTLAISNLTQRHTSVLHKALQQNTIRAQVRAVYPHSPSRTVKVEHNPNLVNADDLCQMLLKYGLHAHVVTDGAAENLVLPLVEDDDVDEKQKAAIMEWQSSQLHLHVIFSGVFWVLSLLAAVEGWHYLEVAGLLSVVFGLPPVALKAFRTLMRLEFDANCMMVTAAIGALLLGEFDEAASVAFLFSVSEFLEARATDKARHALSAIVQLRPEHANVIHPETKEVVVVPADRVPVGSLISVRTGDKIAADGVVVEGSSQVDESSLTGESVPVRKRINDTVSGGCLNIGATRLVVRTTTTVEDSAVSRLIRLVEEAQANRSETEKMIDGFARAYTPAVVLLAGLLCSVPWLWGPEIGRHWTLNGLIIIVISCPCALTISTPVTYAAGLAATAQKGIVVKGGMNLEALGSARTVLFDKTGTLTEGKFKIIHLEEVGETRTRKEMLELLALMEAPSSHPLSATLVKAAKSEGVSAPADVTVEDHSILKGEGVTALVNGKQAYVGNIRLFDRIGMYTELPQAYRGLAEQWSRKGGSVGFLGVEREGIVGIFCVTDVVRPEARHVVETLLFNNISVHMLTGDAKGAALSVADQVGISQDNVHSRLSPEDKLHFVGCMKAPTSQQSYGLMRRQPNVVFVGDGVNDGPAIACSDVGVSMGEGASLAMEMSDVTLMDSNLDKLVYVIKMGTRVVETIQENIVLSLFCKVAVLVFTFFGKMTLLYAIASDVGVMLLVTVNGMKLLPIQDDDDGRQLWSVSQNNNAYAQVPASNSIQGAADDLV